MLYFEAEENVSKRPKAVVSGWGYEQVKATRILLLPALVLAGWGPSAASAAETGFLDRVVVVDEPSHA